MLRRRRCRNRRNRVSNRATFSATFPAGRAPTESGSSASVADRSNHHPTGGRLFPCGIWPVMNRTGVMQSPVDNSARETCSSSEAAPVQIVSGRLQHRFFRMRLTTAKRYEWTPGDLDVHQRFNPPTWDKAVVGYLSLSSSSSSPPPAAFNLIRAKVNPTAQDRLTRLTRLIHREGAIARSAIVSTNLNQHEAVPTFVTLIFSSLLFNDYFFRHRGHRLVRSFLAFSGEFSLGCQFANLLPVERSEKKTPIILLNCIMKKTLR